MSKIRSFVGRVAILLSFGYTFQGTVGHISYVSGQSMKPTFREKGDYVIVDRLSKTHNGDIVVLRSPVHTKRRAICKRLMGQGGDPVIWPKEPGKAIHIPSAHISQWFAHPHGSRVPRGKIWVLGDNCHSSTDSRSFGPVPSGLIEGRVVFRIWPPRSIGFMKRTLDPERPSLA